MSKPCQHTLDLGLPHTIACWLSRAIAVLALLLVVRVSVGAELEIRVHPPSSVLPSDLPECRIEEVFACNATLIDAFAIIQNPQWQSSVSVGFSKVTLQLAPGIYRLAEPVALHWGSGATKNVRLEIVGASQATVISGARTIEDWELASGAYLPKRTSSRARGKLWVADVARLNLSVNAIPQARGYGLPIRPVLTELFVGNAIQPIAAWPNAGFGKLRRAEDLPLDNKKTFSVDGREVSDWADEPDLQVEAFWGLDWAAQSYLIATKDVAANTLTLLGAGSPYGIKHGQRARVENALAELDSPGEWYLDRAAAKLYFLPSSGFKGKGGELSVASGLLLIETSTQIVIRDLVIEKTRGDAVTVKKSREVVFDHVVIRFTGNRGLVIEDSFNTGIRNSLIEDNGEGGVFLSGGDRNTLQVGGNFVENNVIRRFSRLVKTSRFAVEIVGVGQRVVGNTISNAPHTAILFKGNDHLISNNEIFDVVRETSDAGAIYVGRDFTVHGTTIEGNFLHDIVSSVVGSEVKGVYIDDQASGITVRGNIFARVQQPVFLSGGRDNLIENNLFFRSTPAIHLDARGIGSQQHETLNPKGTLQRGLDAVPYRGSLYASRYPHLANIRNDDFGAPKYNVFRNNLIVGGEMARVEKKAQAGIEIRDNRQRSDSVFEKEMPAEMRRRREDFRRLTGFE